MTLHISNKIPLLSLAVASLLLWGTHAFVASPPLSALPRSSHASPRTAPNGNILEVKPSSWLSSSSLALLPPSSSSSVFWLAEEMTSWREYVPLVVSLLVMLDIFLGSPAANAVLSLVRPNEDDVGASSNGVESTTPGTKTMSPLEALQRAATGENVFAEDGPQKDPKERIDTTAFAQQALEKAEATKELRQFLEDNKSDWDKIQDVQRQMDEQLAQFDNERKDKDEK